LDAQSLLIGRFLAHVTGLVSSVLSIGSITSRKSVSFLPRSLSEKCLT
jgi:hypothetical protein